MITQREHSTFVNHSLSPSHHWHYLMTSDDEEHDPPPPAPSQTQEGEKMPAAADEEEDWWTNAAILEPSAPRVRKRTEQEDAKGASSSWEDEGPPPVSVEESSVKRPRLPMREEEGYRYSQLPHEDVFGRSRFEAAPFPSAAGHWLQSHGQAMRSNMMSSAFMARQEGATQQEVGSAALRGHPGQALAAVGSHAGQTSTRPWASAARSQEGMGMIHHHPAQARAPRHSDSAMQRLLENQAALDHSMQVYLSRSPRPSSDDLYNHQKAHWNPVGSLQPFLPMMPSSDSLAPANRFMAPEAFDPPRRRPAASPRASPLDGAAGNIPFDSAGAPRQQEETTTHYSERHSIPLAMEEDSNWLSEFLCFVRLEMVEVFRAQPGDVISRNQSKKISEGQVGIRCRFCAHLSPSARVSRSSSFPSSTSRIYQSLTMMLRDHFPSCPEIPDDIANRFRELKEQKTRHGAPDSRGYWVESAKAKGMVDTATGIRIHGLSSSPRAQSQIPPAVPASPPAQRRQSSLIRQAQDHSLLTTVSPFWIRVLEQVKPVVMQESEQTGSRKVLPRNFPGLACVHCWEQRRMGLARVFPSRRTKLPEKLIAMYEHLRRCTLCPSAIQDELGTLHERHEQTQAARIAKRDPVEAEFFDRVWQRMGH